MKRVLYAWCLFANTMVWSQKLAQPEVLPQNIVKNTYHGVTIEDPYQYLENLDDPAVINWMKSNAQYANSVMDNISGKQEMLDKMMELMNRTSAAIGSLRITDDNTYFYLKRVPGEEIFKMYKRDGYEGKETLFFDPNNYKKDSGKTYTINGITLNDQGDKVAVTLAANGSENPEVLIFTSEGEKFKETIELGDGISWLPSGDAFYYNKLHSADVTDMNRIKFTNVYVHQLGTEQEADTIYFSIEDYEALGVDGMEIPMVIYDKNAGLNVLIIASVDKNTRAYFQSPSGNSKVWKSLSQRSDLIVDYQVNNENLYFMTYLDSPNYQIKKVSLQDLDVSKATTVVPESKNEIITGMKLTKDGLYYTTMKNGVEAQVYFLAYNSSTLKQLKLPFTAGDASLSNKGSEFSDIWISISGWTSPDKRYLYHPKDDAFEYQPLSTPAEYPELKDLIAKEVMVASHDGVMVPVSIIYNKNIKLDGSNPGVIYSYGSYGNSTSPFFSPITLAYTLYDGVLIVPHVRGGGELGDSWHKAGQKLNKPNTWKDAIAAAEYVIKEGYTSSDKLAIFGGSAGGILVGRSITERPDLFVAAAPMLGAMNTVRMEETPNGPVNTPEFGTVQDPEEFKGLLEMDSYLNLKPGTDYPATLITAGINDPRVIAWQPAKFAAKLQHDNVGDSPVLFLTDFEGGHGGGVALTKALNNFSNVFSFFYWQSGHPKFKLKESIKD